MIKNINAWSFAISTRIKRTLPSFKKMAKKHYIRTIGTDINKLSEIGAMSAPV